MDSHERMAALRAEDKARHGIGTVGDEGFACAHDAFEDRPRITVCVEALGKSAGPRLAALRHEVGHAALHGRRLFYEVRMDTALRRGAALRGLAEPALLQLLCFVAVAAKDWEVRHLLLRHGFKEDVWTLARELPAPRGEGLSAQIWTEEGGGGAGSMKERRMGRPRSAGRTGGDPVAFPADPADASAIEKRDPHHPAFSHRGVGKGRREIAVGITDDSSGEGDPAQEGQHAKLPSTDFAHRKQPATTLDVQGPDQTLAYQKPAHVNGRYQSVQSDKEGRDGPTLRQKPSRQSLPQVNSGHQNRRKMFASEDGGGAPGGSRPPGNPGRERYLK